MGSTATGSTGTGSTGTGATGTGATGTGLTLSGACWPEVDAQSRRLLVVPVGSLEQHGPHLPLDTDTRIAVALAARACAGRAGVGLAPPIAIGASGEHADFPGTLSIGTAALTLVLIELGRHAALHWPALLLVNGHGGNVPAITEAVAQLRAEGRHCHAWHAALRAPVPPGTATAGTTTAGTTTAGATTAGATPPGTTPPGTTTGAAGGTRAAGSGLSGVVDAHAGRVETSIMLALAPGDVRLAAAAPGETRPLTQIMPALRAHGVRHVSANGVLGNPAGASAAEGERLLRLLTTSLRDTVDGLTAHHSYRN